MPSNNTRFDPQSYVVVIDMKQVARAEQAFKAALAGDEAQAFDRKLKGP